MDIHQTCLSGTDKELSVFTKRQIAKTPDAINFAAANPNPSCLQFILGHRSTWSKFQLKRLPEGPVHAAARANLPANIELLLQFKAAEVNDRCHSSPGETALHIAFSSKRSKAARCLLRHGADPLIEDDNGMTPLHLILGPSRVDKNLEKVVLDHGFLPQLATIAARAGTSATFLWIMRKHNLSNFNELFDEAIMFGNEKVALALLTADLIDIDSNLPQNKTQAPPLVQSIIYGFDEVAELLIKKGARDTSDTDGYNPVIAAAATDKDKLLRILLQKGYSTVTAETNAMENAVSACSVKCLRILLDHGEPTAGLDLSCCPDECMELLVAAGVDKSQVEDSNETADCLQSVKSLKDISRDCVRNLVDRKRTNVFHVVKCLNLPQGLAQILLLGMSSGP